MIYSIYEFQQRIAQVTKQYGVKAIFLFGSYARGEAREDSDIDLLVDTSGTNLRSLLSLGALYCDLEAALQKANRSDYCQRAGTTCANAQRGNVP